MPYKVIVDRKDGNRVEVADIHLGPTPHVGDKVVVSINGYQYGAKVKGVRAFPCKSPETAVQTVDSVDADEL